MGLSSYSMFPFIIASVVILIITSFLYERKRTKDLKNRAKMLGLNFSKSGRDVTWSNHDSFEIFNSGHSRKIKNEMWKLDADNDVSIFGYEYTQGHGKNSSTHKQTILSIKSSKLCAPNFQLKPENTLHKIGQVFGYQDIDFPEYPIFSKNYLLRGKDEQEICDFFSDKVIDHFENNLNIHIEAERDRMIFYRPSKRFNHNEIEEFYIDGKKTLRRLIES